MKHTATPGPWTDFDGIVSDEKHNGIADCQYLLRSKLEQSANARLIAAAPELLEACKAVEEWWLREGKHEFLGAPAGIFMLRAAIQKAEGGE